MALMVPLTCLDAPWHGWVPMGWGMSHGMVSLFDVVGCRMAWMGSHEVENVPWHGRSL